MFGTYPNTSYICRRKYTYLLYYYLFIPLNYHIVKVILL